jgi:hypothetical protein
MSAAEPHTETNAVEVADADLDQVRGGDATNALPAVQAPAEDAGAQNIGSQSSGAGAGKITFNPFSITRKP